MSLSYITQNWTEHLTKGVKQIDTDHAYIHDGIAFEATYAASVNGNLSFEFVTPGSTTGRYVHFRPVDIATEKGIVIFSIIEGSTRGSTGSTVETYNRNRTKTNVSEVTFKVDDGTTVGSGTVVYSRKLFGGTGPGNTAIGTKAGSELEWVLKQGTKYAMMLSTTEVILTNTNFFWYEESAG